MNRRFPLATVARVRRLQTSVARAAVGEAHVTLARAAAATSQASDYLDAVRRPGDGELPSAGLLARHRSGLAAADALDSARAAEGEAQDIVDARVAAWVQARGRERGVELLEQRHAEAVAAADEKAAQAAADDRAGRARVGRRVGASS